MLSRIGCSLVWANLMVFLGVFFKHFGDAAPKCLGGLFEDPAFHNNSSKSQKNMLPECQNLPSDSLQMLHIMQEWSPDGFLFTRTRKMTILQSKEWWSLLWEKEREKKASNTVFVQAPAGKLSIWRVAAGAGFKAAGAEQELALGLGDGCGQAEKPNGKSESRRLARTQNMPSFSAQHSNVLTSKSQEAQLEHRYFVWK